VILNESVPATPVESLGTVLPLWSVLPFVALLAAIAVLPLAAPGWWGKNRNRALVSLSLALPLAAGLLLAHPGDGSRALLASIRDYASFICLLAALYVISGGIHVRGSLAGSPLSNTAMLGIGALLANLIGTTGASMILIRPLLRANRPRRRKAHLVVFFIFVVSNCGGLLTPLGDPPLFLGFLKGVPFAWTFGLWSEWLIANGILLVVFQFLDGWMLERDEMEMRGSQLEEVLRHEPLSIDGVHNLLLLVGVILVIVGRGRGIGSSDGSWAFGVQEGAMIGLAAGSYALTKPSTRAANAFTFGPIVEVAVLFAGIFVTMVAPLEILNARGGALGLARPSQYFWATGALSSFLDNAPTYMTFAASACGRAGVRVQGSHYLREFLAQSPGSAGILAAISCGAVMMGAMTYIGNGPNFMVKSIADQAKVKMPGFFAYLLRFAAPILLPLFGLIALLFFSRWRVF
jgi:Na+/H+ antiporter NhaD/arsenite permease-like protein